MEIINKFDHFIANLQHIVKQNNITQFLYHNGKIVIIGENIFSFVPEKAEKDIIGLINIVQFESGYLVNIEFRKNKLKIKFGSPTGNVFERKLDFDKI